MYSPASIKSKLEWGIRLLILALPLAFNPWAALPFEPIKAHVLRFGVVFLFGLALLSWGYIWQRSNSWATVSPVNGIVWQRTHLLVALALLYAAIHLAATLYSVNPLQSLWGNSDKHGMLTTWGYVGLSLAVYVLFSTRSSIDRLLLTLLAASVPICLYGFVQAAGVDPLAWQTDSVSPVLSTLGRSNYLGAYLAILLPISCYMWQRFSRYGRFIGTLFVCLFVMQVTCLLLTQARAGALAAIGGLSVMWICWQWGRSWRRMVVGVLVIGLFGAGLVLIVENQRPFEPQILTNEHATNTQFSERRTAAINRRPIIWRSTVALIQKRWLIGYGPETFPDIFNQTYPPGTLYDGRDSVVDDPHNLLLAEWMATGLIGLLVLVMLIGRWFRNYIHLFWQTEDLEQRLLIGALLGAMSAYIVQAQFNPDVVAVSALFWIILGIRMNTRSSKECSRRITSASLAQTPPAVAPTSPPSSA